MRRDCHCGESGFFHCSDLLDEIERLRGLMEKAGLPTGRPLYWDRCGEHGVEHCEECDA